MPSGVEIYGHQARTLEALPPPTVPRAEVIDELFDAVINGRAPVHSGEWGLATMEVSFAILESAAAGRELQMSHQCGIATRA